MIAFQEAPGRLPAGRRVYAIGDIHGSLGKLRDLHAMIARDVADRPVDHPVLVHLGDYVDKAGDVRGVVDYLASGDPVPGVATKFLTGNHEETMLAALDGVGGATADWLWGGGKATLESWEIDPESPRETWPAAFSDSQIAFLRRLDLYHAEEGYLFVHAGIRPGIPLHEQSREDLLRIRHDFLNSTRDHGFVVVHGHTAGFGPVVRPNRICVDTAAWSGGKLTCAVIEENRLGFLGA